MTGSLPHTDPIEACRLVTRFLKDIPVWPQLPKRSFLENMYVQYSQGFPGVVIEREGEKIYIDRSKDLSKPLERLYQAYLENDFAKYPISQEYAPGLYAFLALENLTPRAVKGQVTGPISWGLTVLDQDKKSILYDDVLGDAVAKLLRLKAGWQERVLKKLSRNTIIFLDEPYMTSYGSAYISLSRERVISLLDEVFGGIRGLKGVHCCGNTDWSVLLATSVNILNFDAYNFAESLTLYPKEVKRFLERGNAIAWGIVPNQPETLAKETVASLKDPDLVPRGRARNKDARDYLLTEMKRRSYAVLPSDTNFAMIDIQRPVEPVIKAFREQGIAVGRRFPAQGQRQRRADTHHPERAGG